MSADPILEQYLPYGGKGTPDKLRGEGGIFNPVNLSLYHFSGNNPLKYTDPTGEGNILTAVYLIYKALTGNKENSNNNSSISNNGARILQTDPRISYKYSDNGKEINAMGRYGCNFRSLQGIAETKIGKNLTPDQINTAREELQKSGSVRLDMYVRDPVAVINNAFEKLGSNITAEYLGKNYNKKDVDATIVVGNTQYGLHFREGDKEGKVLNDPDPNVKIISENSVRGVKLNEKNKK